MQPHGRVRVDDDNVTADASASSAPRDVKLLGELGHRQPAREAAQIQRCLQASVDPLGGADRVNQHLAVPNAMFRKYLIGPRLRARKVRGQRGRAAIVDAVLDTIIRAAKPASVRIA